jgi:hypothetical protein
MPGSSAGSRRSSAEFSANVNTGIEGRVEPRGTHANDGNVRRVLGTRAHRTLAVIIAPNVRRAALDRAPTDVAVLAAASRPALNASR